MIPIVVVAHPQRREMAVQLLSDTRAEALVWDNYSLLVGE